MAQKLDLPLPELTCSSREEFTRAWMRFELVTAAKDWDTEKQLSIAPMLLRGKLVDIYVDFNTETKSDLQLLKDTLMKRAGLDSDSLMIGKEFMSCSQLPNEKVENYSKIAQPLHNLLKKEKNFSRNPEAQDAFEKLKQ